ncbi:MAG: DNA polymerase III subunit [Phototrophicaceae bacterium]
MTRNHNWAVWGHDWAVDFLRTSMQHGRNRHAYLITGANNIGKNQLAHAFAMALNCTQDDKTMRPCGECRSCKLIYSGNHPDILYTDRDERTGRLKIDALRDIMRLLALKPYDSRYRIAIFEGFDHAAPRAQDALLKTLEEPSSYAVMLLLAESTENIMPTITSRCQIVPLRPVPQLEVAEYLQMHGAEAERATLLARLSSGRMGWALNALKDETVMLEREDMLKMLVDAVYGTRVKRFEIAEDLEKIAKKDNTALRYLLETWQTYWRDILLLAQGSPVKPCNSDRMVEMQQLVQTLYPNDALKALHATRKMLNETIKTNANMRMAFEVMFLDYPGLR